MKKEFFKNTDLKPLKIPDVSKKNVKILCFYKSRRIITNPAGKAKLYS